MKFSLMLLLMFFSLRVAAQRDSVSIAVENDSLNYIRAIQQADSCMRLNDFRNAKIFYQVALNLKPAARYPRSQIAFCDGGVICFSYHFEDAIHAGDSLFMLRQYPEAKLKYQEATGLKSTEQYPKNQIAACDAKMAGQPWDNKYGQIILTADTLFKAGKYSDARSQYQIASKLKPSEVYPIDQIIRCDHAIRSLQFEQQFKREMATGDSLFALKKYAEAKLVYMRASAIKPGDPRPPQQIKKCDELLKQD